MVLPSEAERFIFLVNSVNTRICQLAFSRKALISCCVKEEGSTWEVFCSLSWQASGGGTSEITFQPRVRKQAGVCRNVRPPIRPFEREIYVQPAADKRSSPHRPRSRPTTATFRRIDSGAGVWERDAEFRPRHTSSAEGQKDCGGAPARSRLHEKETSGGRWRTEEKNIDGTWWWPGVSEVSRWAGGGVLGIVQLRHIRLFYSDSPTRERNLSRRKTWCARLIKC